jgi:hypothetical protein
MTNGVTPRRFVAGGYSLTQLVTAAGDALPRPTPAAHSDRSPTTPGFGCSGAT